MRRRTPDAGRGRAQVLCNGPGTCVPIVVLAWLFRVRRQWPVHEGAALATVVWLSHHTCGGWAAARAPGAPAATDQAGLCRELCPHTAPVAYRQAAVPRGGRFPGAVAGLGRQVPAGPVPRPARVVSSCTAHAPACPHVVAPTPPPHPAPAPAGWGACTRPPQTRRFLGSVLQAQLERSGDWPPSRRRRRLLERASGRARPNKLEELVPVM